jgi:peptidoglycan/LPS O-acetylase OafA/YrhL
MRTLKPTPALDGVRALAIGLVVLAHALGPTLDALGGLGVVVFFVLSGFLITALLLDERETGRVDLRRFYARRALRLFPALVCLLAVAAALPWYFPSDRALSAPQAVAAAVLYVANWVTGDLGYLSHTWSLAVEEQFYLVWPVVLLALARRRAAFRIGLLIGVLLVVRTVVDLALPGVPHATVSHADQLLIGALLAVLWRTGQASPGAAVTWCCLAAFPMTFLVVRDAGQLRTNVGYTVCAAATGVLIAHLLARDGLLRQAFTAPAAVLVGRVSYGIYLYHWPIFRGLRHVFVTHGWTSPAAHGIRIALALTVTAAAVALSWRFVERPALRLKRRFAARAPAERAAATEQ